MNSQDLLFSKLGGQDHLIFEKLIELFRVVFEMGKGGEPEGNVRGAERTDRLEVNPIAAGGSYLKGLLERPGFMVYAAIYRDEIVGGLTAYELPLYYSKTSEVYIYDIAVTASFQRKGVGKALLSALLGDCRNRPVTSVFVDADEMDEDALDFYHATGGKAANVVHFTYFL